MSKKVKAEVQVEIPEKTFGEQMKESCTPKKLIGTAVSAVSVYVVQAAIAALSGLNN